MCFYDTHLTNLSLPWHINCLQNYCQYDRIRANWRREAKPASNGTSDRMSVWVKKLLELKNKKQKWSVRGGRLDMISGCAATRMTMINVAFPGAPSASLHLSPWWDASQPSQPCKYNKPVLVLSGRSITTKQRLQLWQSGWMCLLGTIM